MRKRATANSFTRALCYYLTNNGHTSTTVLQKNQECTTISSTTRDRQRARVKCKNVRKSNGVTIWRELESTYFVTSISARNTGAWAFFERRFPPLSVGGFFSHQRESNSRCPKSILPSKTQNGQIARTSPVSHSEEVNVLFSAISTSCAEIFDTHTHREKQTKHLGCATSFCRRSCRRRQVQ